MSYYPVAPNEARPAKSEWTIARITDGYIYGTVMSTTERGARIVGAKRFNDAFRFLSATPKDNRTELEYSGPDGDIIRRTLDGSSFEVSKEIAATLEALSTALGFDATIYAKTSEGSYRVSIGYEEEYFTREIRWIREPDDAPADVVVPAWPTADNDYSVTNGEDVTAALIQAGLDDIAETEGLSTMNCAECGAFFGHDDNGPRTVSALAAHAAHICKPDDISATDAHKVAALEEFLAPAESEAENVAESTAAETIGDLRIAVTRDSLDSEGRTDYFYIIRAGDNFHYGNDLKTGVGFDHGPRAMLGTLASFLSAAAESYAYAMRASVGLDETENGTLFPEWVTEAAYIYADELDMLAHDIEEEN